MELPEGHHEHGDNPLIVPVSLTMSILAVLVAAVTLLSHRTHTEELLLQAHAVDQWAYYQAKNNRLHEDQIAVDELAALQKVDKVDQDAANKAREKYAAEAERYASDKEDISEKAKDLEKERDILSKKADRFDGAEALLEIALVICSICLLTKRAAFWYGGMALGALGIALALTAFLIHTP